MDSRHNHGHGSLGAMLLKAAFFIGVAVVKKAIEQSAISKTPPPPAPKGTWKTGGAR